MPNARGGKGTGFGGAATAGRNATSSSAGARAGDARATARGDPHPAAERFNAPVAPSTTSWGAPIHVGPTQGPGSSPISAGISVAKNPQAWKDLQDRVRMYNDAATKWNASAAVPSLGNLVNKFAPLGLSMEPPNINRPATFSGGDYHLGWNPGSLVGLAGAMIPGAGMLTGSLGQAAWTAAGMPNVMLGGQPTSMPNWSKAKGFGEMVAGIPAAPSAPGAPSASPQMGSTGTGGIPWLSALAQQQKKPFGAMIGG